jgi:hypothetical protein
MTEEVRPRINTALSKEHKTGIATCGYNILSSVEIQVTINYTIKFSTSDTSNYALKPVAASRCETIQQDPSIQNNFYRLVQNTSTCTAAGKKNSSHPHSYATIDYMKRIHYYFYLFIVYTAMLSLVQTIKYRNTRE